MAPNEPIIEDPYRRHRRIVPQRPLRRLSGTAPTTVENSTAPVEVPITAPSEQGLPEPAAAESKLAEAKSAETVPVEAKRPEKFIEQAEDIASIAPRRARWSEVTPASALDPFSEAMLSVPLAVRECAAPAAASADPLAKTAISAPHENETAMQLFQSAEPRQTQRLADPQEPSALVHRRSTPPTRQRLAGEEHPSGTSPRSAITLAVLSALLIGYAFNIANLQTGAARMLAPMNTSAQAGGSTFVPLMTKVLPWLLFVPVLVLFYAILKTLASLVGLSRKKRTKAVREERKRPLDEFKKATGKEGVTSRYAYQGYLLLQPYVPAGATLTPGNTLEQDLGMTHSQVRDLHLGLLRATGRQIDPTGKLPGVSTVLDLLLAVQKTPRKQRIVLDPVFEPGDPQRRR